MKHDKKNPGSTSSPESIRTSLSLSGIKQDLNENLQYILGKPASMITLNDQYLAVAYSVRNRMIQYWMNTVETFFMSPSKAVCYFSAEFLIGPQLKRNLISLGIYDTMKLATHELNMDLDAIIEHEPEPGLGNGGLGRLAACYMESLATLGVPAIGFGIRYEHGMFHQTFRDGWQVELTDNWLQLGNPWEIPRPERVYDVYFGGHTESYPDANGRTKVKWIPGKIVKGMAYDTPIMGYKTETAGMLRLWKAEAHESFDFQDFNTGDYYGAVEMKVAAENITKVLYPNDEQLQGKRLRLEQQYFFVSCSLQNLIEMHLLKNAALDDFPETFAVQLNDTHPSIAVAELMRLLVDKYNLEWDNAWRITEKTFCYTNHTLLPEALEKWSVPLFSNLLPRHMEIIFDINQQFLDDVRARFPQNNPRIGQLSLIDETGEKYVRMANLACVGSHAINGVAELHTELLKKHTLSDFYAITPQKFSNKTNGVTPRRWMVLCNPRLTSLITEKIGDGWIQNLEKLKELEAFADDKEFLAKWWLVKQNNKREQAEYVFNKTKVSLNTYSLFDVQVKRIHEYKRQHLNLLHIITLYNRIKQNPGIDITPRTFVFGGKAAPGYEMAKLIIKLINSVANVVNTDPDVGERLKIVFIRNFNVKIGHRVYPPADLSEQISTAGKEASGTGNMKFSMNGALTIGTLDGANVEIRQEVGAENFFLFGLDATQVEERKASGYSPMDYCNSNEELRAVIDRIQSGFFSGGDENLFRPLVDSLLYEDKYMLMADYQSYLDCQEKVNALWKDQEAWTRVSMLNVARIGKFSSDRAIREYCRDIWKIDL
ncbi:MAG: glycogen/starch/alpha-glucan phosphorylase [Desulfobacteraceae bacterium]|nr:MAG: glycogen/starch/alpha-glucan phosphorylase [Desulfobacteraceae bacterium]